MPRPGIVPGGRARTEIQPAYPNAFAVQDLVIQEQCELSGPGADLEDRISMGKESTSSRANHRSLPMRMFEYRFDSV